MSTRDLVSGVGRSLGGRVMWWGLSKDHATNHEQEEPVTICDRFADRFLTNCFGTILTADVAPPFNGDL